MTDEELMGAIDQSIKDFSTALRPLVGEASRRLSAADGESLKKTFKYATHLLATVELARPK